MKIFKEFLDKFTNIFHRFIEDFPKISCRFFENFSNVSGKFLVEKVIFDPLLCKNIGHVGSFRFVDFVSVFVSLSLYMHSSLKILE